MVWQYEGPRVKGSTDLGRTTIERCSISERSDQVVATGRFPLWPHSCGRGIANRSKISQIIFVGGSVDRGNHTPAAEFNTTADPRRHALVRGPRQKGVVHRNIGFASPIVPD